MTARRFRAVVFDLDDTLYPESQFVLSGFRAVARYVHKMYGIDIYPALAERYAAGERGNLIASAMQERFRVVEPLLIQKLAEIYRCHYPKIELFQDARVGLALLSGRRIRIGLVTDGYGCVQKNKVEALGLAPLIDSMVFADDLGGEEYWKPSPEPFFILALQLELDPGQMAYVGDNASIDFLGPRKIGMATIHLVRKGAEYASVQPPTPAHAPHLRIGSLNSILQALAELEQREWPPQGGSEKTADMPEQPPSRDNPT